jgi:hypothetical protein
MRKIERTMTSCAIIYYKRNHYTEAAPMMQMIDDMLAQKRSKG